MIKTDEDSLVCDLAETYNIYDYEQLPLKKVAVFSYGLKDDSRIKMKLNGQTTPLDTLILAGISDKVNSLVWFQTEDGQKGRNRPKSLADTLINYGKNDEKDDDMVVFHSGEDFERLRQELIKGGGE